MIAIELDDRWSIAGHPHGGYLLREVVRPVVTVTHPHPLAVSAHFLRSPDPGPATIEVETLRVGRSVSQHRARLVQHDLPVIEALVTTGTLDPAAEPHWSAAGSGPPVMAPLADSVRSRADRAPGMRVGHLDFVDVRPPADAPGFGQPSPTPGLVTARLQMLDRAEGGADVLDLLVLADALQPVAMSLGIPGWFPTVKLTVLIRAVPAPGWLIGEQHATLLQDGWFDERCTLWDSRGRIVCQATQLAGYRL